jgi:hypothetical protein
MNVKSILVLAVSGIIVLDSNAQEDKLNKTLPVFSAQTEKDTVLERISYTMEGKVERYLSFTDSLDRAKLKNTGYRIQIYSNSGPAAKETAIKQQSEFLKLHEKTPSYTKWSYPNWVVRVGDFRTKLEALEMHLAIRELYPASFIISDEIVVKY